MSTVSLNGSRVTRLRFTMPTWGTWTADAILASTDTIPAASSLVIGDLTLSGTVRRQASFAGSKSARIIGGGAGWRNMIKAKGYSTVAGVKMSTVLADVAREAGENIVVTNDRILGTQWARERANGERTLRLLLGGQWWVDPAGVTQTAARASTLVTSPFNVVEWSGSKGKFEIATEAVSQWLPGRTFTAPTVSGTQTISSMSVDADNEGKLRITVLSIDSTQERLLRDMRAIIRSEVPSLTFSGMWEYTIASATSSTVDVVSTSPIVPDLTGVPMRPGLMGEVVTPTPGSLCRIMFVNADPSRPECVGIIGSPIKVEICKPLPTQAAARFGDPVSGVAITGGSTKVFIGNI